MADNITIKDAAGADVIISAKDLASVFLPRHVRIDEAGNVLSDDMMLDIARGLITGVSHINKFGSNEAIPTGTTEDIWDGGDTYVYPATALMTSLSQTSDQIAMRGENIWIEGLDASWDYIAQTIALNASNTETAVTLSTPLLRVNRMEVQADVVGDSDIRLHNVGETVNYAIITAGNNQTEMALYSVANGKTVYMSNYYFDGVSNSNQTDYVIFSLWAADRGNGYEFKLKQKRKLSAGAPAVGHEYRPFNVFTQKTDIKCRANSVGGTSSCHAGFDLIIVDN